MAFMAINLFLSLILLPTIIIKFDFISLSFHSKRALNLQKYSLYIKTHCFIISYNFLILLFILLIHNIPLLFNLLIHNIPLIFIIDHFNY